MDKRAPLVSESFSPEGARSAHSPLVAWPPPGLERLQGDLQWVINRLGLGGAIFTLPLLAALTLPQAPWRSGIYGDAWWVVLITSLVGLWFLLGGYVMLLRVLGRWRTATSRGYGIRTVALVLADQARDTGFLVQGGRAYSLLAEGARHALLERRLLQAGLLAGAAAWTSAGFLLGVLMAAHGMIGEAGLASWTLLPPALAAATVAVLRLWEDTVLVKARRQWHAQPWSEDLERDEIRDWHAAVADRGGAVGVSAGSGGGGRATLRGAAVVAGFAGVAILLLSLPLVTTSGIGPVLTAVVVPNFSSVSERAARTEALTPLRLSVDASVSAQQAGEALSAIVALSDPELLKRPVRSYDPIFPDDTDTQNPTGSPAYRWAHDLVPRLTGGLDPAVVTYLDELGHHPALSELTVLSRAGALDEIGAVYVLPLPEDMAAAALPIPRYSGLRELAWAQVGAAVGAAALGRVPEAETRLREVISAGLLMGHDGSTLILNLTGYLIAGMGGEALTNLYAATGRPAEAAALGERMRASERAAHLGATGRGGNDLAAMPAVVTDTTAVRGVRWEYLIILNTVGPCLNLNWAVFGPSEGYGSWLDRARASLVRTEGEEQLFRIAQRGWGAPDEGAGRELMAGLFSQVMGSREGSCGRLVADVVG